MLEAFEGLNQKIPGGLEFATGVAGISLLRDCSAAASSELTRWGAGARRTRGLCSATESVGMLPKGLELSFINVNN